MISLLGDNPLRTVQDCELPKNLWDRLQERYEGRDISQLTLINSLLNMRYRRNQNMENHISVLESQFARLALMSAEFHDSRRLAIVIAALKNYNAFEPLTTSAGVMKKNNHSWRQMFSFFSKENNWVLDDTGTTHNNMEMILGSCSR